MAIVNSSFARLSIDWTRSPSVQAAIALVGCAFVACASAGSAAYAQDHAPETLECDVQFEVQNFLKDSYLLQPSKDLPASVPTAASGRKPFGSYRLDIDWKARSARVHTTPVAVGTVAPAPVAYTITSDPAADVIQLEAAGKEAAKADAFPSRIFIRRVSGWFMRLEPLSSKPTTGFTEVGVCGRDQKF